MRPHAAAAQELYVMEVAAVAAGLNISMTSDQAAAAAAGSHISPAATAGIPTTTVAAAVVPSLQAAAAVPTNPPTQPKQ